MKTQQVIDKLTAGKKVLQLSTELPDMQKEVDAINKLTGSDYRVKIKSMGFDEIINKINFSPKHLRIKKKGVLLRRNATRKQM
jgi:ADP-dependent phosphofructokinase/glucokinase